MKTRVLSEWADALEASAAPVLADAGFVRSEAWARGFADDVGVRTAVAGPLLAHVCGHKYSGPDGATLDLRLWAAVARRKPASVPGEGALVGLDAAAAIEVATEIELSALHALGWLALRSGEEAEWDRVRSAANWNTAEVQPDNATNRPWAVGVFLWLWCAEESPEALVHGETLWHNCRVSRGRPDRLSAVILHDAANWLRAVERQG